MKKGHVKLGDIVAVNEVHDGQLYRVGSISPDGLNIGLSYRYLYGWTTPTVVDISYLSKPTVLQLENEARCLYALLETLDEQRQV